MIVKVVAEFDITFNEEKDLKDVAKYLETHTKEDMKSDITDGLTELLSSDIGEQLKDVKVSVTIED